MAIVFKRMFFACCVFLWMSHPSLAGMQGASRVITNGKKVLLEYTLTVDGKTIDSSVNQEPLYYVHGSHQIVPGLEKQLAGLTVGDEKSITVTPEEGYGKVNPDALRELPKSSFPAQYPFTVGMIIEMQDQEGHKMPAYIAEVKDKTIVLNFNHPLAGKTLNFKIKIVSIE